MTIKEQIFDLIKNNPGIPQKELKFHLNYNGRISKILGSLRSSGIIYREWHKGTWLLYPK